MKRMLSLVMVLVLVLSLGTVAFAGEVEEEESKWDGTYTATTSTTFNIKKTYNIENDVTVDETLTFTSTPDKENPDYATNDDGTVKDSVANLTVKSLDVGNMTASNGTASADIEVTVPSYSQAGVYNYTIKETAGNTAGVEYSSAEIKVRILVEYDNVEHKLVIGNPKDPQNSGITYYILKTAEGNNEVKADTFTNTFKSGSFTVAKDVDGNMANETDKFEISVTLTSTKPIGTNVSLAGETVAHSAWTTNYETDGTTVKNYTYTKELEICEKDGEQTFANIPVGVTVTVAEDTDTEKMNGYTYAGTSVDSTVKKTGENLDASVSFTIDDTTDSAIVVKNTKTTSVDTGISMDTLPYVLLLAVACVGIIALVSKKRLAREH